jgi:CheY-like chemotaxis protein
MRLREIKDVLIVDDEEDVRTTICAAVEREGLSCHVAVDGLDALERMGKYRYLVILLDLSMPRLNGSAFLERIGPPSKEQPIVFVLTGASDSSVSLPPDYVQAIIRKPANLRDLADLVRGCVVARRADLGL